MRRNLTSVPVLTTVGHMPAKAADELVAAGRAHSLRGKALLTFDPAWLERILSDLDIDPATAALILRASQRVRDAKAASNEGASHAQSDGEKER